jgi:glycopeptide antibiotics resistance protein
MNIQTTDICGIATNAYRKVFQLLGNVIYFFPFAALRD